MSKFELVSESLDQQSARAEELADIKEQVARLTLKREAEEAALREIRKETEAGKECLEMLHHKEEHTLALEQRAAIAVQIRTHFEQGVPCHARLTFA